MKVGILYYSFFNPLIFRDAKAHLDREDEVDVICYARPDEQKSIYHGRLNVHRLVQRGYDEKYPVRYLIKICYFLFLASVKILILHLKKPYDIIYVISPPDFMVFAAIVPKILGAKVIIKIHDIVPEFYMRKFGVKEKHIITKILKFVEKICCRFSDHVFTVTDIWRDKLIERTGISGLKCSVLMNVPDDKLVKLARGSEILPNRHFRLLYPGNLGEHFGAETLIRAMPLLKKDIPSVRLDIYGDGLKKKYFQKVAKMLEVDGIISFNKIIPIEELLIIMRKVDIGVVPTLDGVFSGEALSMKSLEFLAVGTPIIISRTRSSQYYYNDSMVVFFKPGDHHDLARCIIELYKDRDRRKALVRNAEQFNEKHNWDHYKRIYLGTADRLVG